MTILIVGAGLTGTCPVGTMKGAGLVGGPTRCAGLVIAEQGLKSREAALREGLAVAIAVEGALVGVEAERADLELVAGGAGETKAGLGEPTKGGLHGRAVVRVRGDGDRCSVVRGAGHEGLLPAVK